MLATLLRWFVMLAVVAAPLETAAAETSGRSTPRLGVLLQGQPRDAIIVRVRQAIDQGLREHGWPADGRTIAITYLYADLEGLPGAARELVRRGVDVILAGGTPAAIAARRATSSIPIVAAAMADPVADGLVATLARPGGNVTGNSFLAPALEPKRLQILEELIPGIRRVAVLEHPGVYGEQTMRDMRREIEATAKASGMALQILGAARPEDFEGAFAAMVKGRAAALMVLPSPMFYVNHRRLVDLAVTHRLPTVFNFREAAEAGGLLSYGANVPDLMPRAIAYVDKILKGAKAAELPVEEPTTFELVINARTAKALGVAIPQSLLLRADKVIDR